MRLCPKYTLGFLSRVLKICLLYCFHGLFVALAVKQMYLLLSVPLCKTIFPSRWHHTALWSSAHYLLLPCRHSRMVQNGFRGPFYFTDVLRSPKKLLHLAVGLFDLRGEGERLNYLKRKRSGVDLRRQDELLWFQQSWEVRKSKYCR